MGGAILDQNILQKLATKHAVPIQQIRVKVSKKAARLRVSAEAALVLLAEEAGIGSAYFQRTLSPGKISEIQNHLSEPKKFSAGSKSDSATSKNVSAATEKRNAMRATIRLLLQDDELHDRCTDLLLAKAHFDRPINIATTVLEDRIRRKSQPAKRMVGANLVSYSFSTDPQKTVLLVSANPDEQEGIALALRGLMMAFRNPTHHHVVESFSREDALKVCGFIDVMLSIVDKSRKTNQ